MAILFRRLRIRREPHAMVRRPSNSALSGLWLGRRMHERLQTPVACLG